MRASKTAITACLLFISSLANAALINVAPNIFRDTATDLEWVRVTESTSEALGLTDPLDENSTATASEIITAALASDYVVNQGFRVANTYEVNGLYNGSGAVVDFVENICCGIPDTLNPYVEIFDLGYTDVWSEQTPFPSNSGGQEQRALHMNGGGDIVFSEFELTGQYQLGDFGAFGSSYLVGEPASPAKEYSSFPFEFTGSKDDIGVYLVRTVVPVPPAVWLLGSGLLVLLRMRRR